MLISYFIGRVRQALIREGFKGFDGVMNCYKLCTPYGRGLATLKQRNIALQPLCL